MIIHSRDLAAIFNRTHENGGEKLVGGLLLKSEQSLTGVSLSGWRLYREEHWSISWDVQMSRLSDVKDRVMLLKKRQPMVPCNPPGSWKPYGDPVYEQSIFGMANFAYEGVENLERDWVLLKMFDHEWK